MSPSLKGLLLRVPAGSAHRLVASEMRLGVSGSRFEFDRLFSTRSSEPGIAADGKDWFLARLTDPVDEANPWDLAYEAREKIIRSPSLMAGVVPDLIEPDLLQDWLPDIPMPSTPLPASNDVCVFNDQNPELPTRPAEFAWHLGDSFSQLASARAEISEYAALVRIVHLDTGYDPNHVTFPMNFVDIQLERNFIDDGNPNSARDPGHTGLLRNPGHGTATLALLAGARFRFSQSGYHFDDALGGMPLARVVPVRVGNSVVQLTTSSVARGIGYAAELCLDEQTRVHVISMSMGGVASQAWADAVNNAYEAGIAFVAAAGNNISAGFFGFPTHQIVYPARFRRVIAACGVMANRLPYYGLKFRMMQGNWGPQTSMATAMSAFTPNVPWASIGCSQIVSMDGAGTSSATPQIAAAAALYLHVHAEELFDPDKYPEPWMRVEAVRRALFLSADKSADGGSSEKLGNGILQAAHALEFAPAAKETLHKTRVDSAGFPFLNVLSRHALAPSSEDRMLQLEATQLVQHWNNMQEENPLERAVDDPDRESEDVSPDQIQDFLEILRGHLDASQALRQRASEVLDASSRRSSKPKASEHSSVPRINAFVTAASHADFVPPDPPFRALRGYVVDPSLATSLDTSGISEVAFRLPWETLRPGPVGEYLEVMDLDPASDCFYEPVDLDDPALLAQDGLPPSEGVPQFHQQMTYAICSLTIHNFERALGRKALWRPKSPDKNENPKDDSHYVQRLRVYPHALREANAFYSPNKVALLFGYFDASSDDPRNHLPGGRVFTCLSHDIVAHETTHALLDGMHRQFLLPSNRDVHAFHEGFADCVAMLQHFTFPELVAHQIATTRGAIDAQENLLVQLASQFGRATGNRMALRDAIGREKDGVWQLHEPDPQEYETVQEAHARGRILVSAVFDAFLSIYRRRAADLLRLATGGSGILRPGAIHPDLVNRLAHEAAKSAQHVLTMCIRALDYCPPTDITFGEYLRAIITADYDLVPYDDLNYRVSFVESFRRRGIFPPGVRTLSVGSLLWRSPEAEDPMPSDVLLQRLKQLRDPGMEHAYAESREQIFQLQRRMRRDLHNWLSRHFQNANEGRRDARFLGLDPEKSFEVHTARIAYRSSPDGGMSPQLLVVLLQSTTKPVDPRDPKGPAMSFQGGCTVIADLRASKVRYCIRKHLASSSRLSRQQQFALNEFDSLHATYLGVRSLSDTPSSFGQEPFAVIHRVP